jgi:hypothetical protein
MGEIMTLPTGNDTGPTVAAAAGAFLGSLRNPNTARAYTLAIGKTATHLGEHRPLATVTDDEIGEALELLWGEAAVTTWNARRAAVGAWLTWCRDTHTAPAIPAWTKRLPVPDSDTPARTRFEIDRLIAHRDLDTREKTLYRMLYETAGRAEEILGLNIEDLDVPARRAQVQAKGARAKTRRRGQTRDDLVLETVYWDAGTAGPAPAKRPAHATSAPTPVGPACPTARPAPSSTPTPPPTAPAPAGTSTNSGTPPSPTSARTAPACSS